MRQIMTPNQKFVLVAIAIISIVSLSTVFLYIYMTIPKQAENKQAENFETFEEIDETYIYVDRQGNATCQFTAQLPPSKLADALKSAYQQLGTSAVEQQLESTRSGWGQFGMNVKNPACEVTGFSSGENFKLIVTWKMPNIARRKDNNWTISSEWVDNQTGAQDTIDSNKYAWIVYRNISKNARFIVYTRTVIVLPESAENINCPLINNTCTIDYGGGSRSESSLYAEQIDGRSAITENGLTLISTASEMTITPEKLLENLLSYNISYYGAFSTDNLSFENSIGRVYLDLKYGLTLDAQYSIFIGRSAYSLSPAQLLYYTAGDIVAINQGSQFSIQQPISVAAPSNENGDLGAFWGSLSKVEYVDLAQQVCDNITSTGVAPGVITTPRGRIRFKDALLTFARILSAYEENGVLPNTIMLAPSPSSQLSWGNIEVPANYAYFLLPDTYVITNTTRANQVLDNIRQPGYDNRALAIGLWNWGRTNIRYTQAYATSPLTSEWVLENKWGQCREYANVNLALLRTARMPAKRIIGWIPTGAWQPPAGLEAFMKSTTPDGRVIGAHAWTRVYLPGEGWTFSDSTTPGYFENIPYDIYQQQEQTWVGALAGYETAYGMI